MKRVRTTFNKIAIVVTWLLMGLLAWQFVYYCYGSHEFNEFETRVLKSLVFIEFLILGICLKLDD